MAWRINRNGFSATSVHKALFSFCLVLFSIYAPSQVLAITLTQPLPYYGADFYKQAASGARDKALIQSLQAILETNHLSKAGSFDAIDSPCDTAKAASCYSHHSVGYNAARKALMGQLHLSETAGHYYVKDVYCEQEFSDSDIGPGKIPKDTKLNTEHTWPQSRFTGRYSKDTQKSDLHHLFPTQTTMNSIRGNKKFGEVTHNDKALPCPIAKFGTIDGYSDDYFEPPTAHKGNVARALFYFSVRYHVAISAEEEGFLRKWHRQDPADADERARNDAIFKIQGNRNPFIDHAELVDAIADF